MNPPLMYRDREMKIDPVNKSLARCAGDLIRGDTIGVCLEPGDATRYDLLIVPADSVSFNEFENREHPMKGWYYITRIRSGSPMGSCLYAPHCWKGELRPVTGGNDWAHEVIGWWLDELFSEIEQMRKAIV